MSWAKPLFPQGGYPPPAPGGPGPVTGPASLPAAWPPPNGHRPDGHHLGAPPPPLPAAPPAGAGSEIDWELVRRLRREVSEELSAKLGADATLEDERAEGEVLVNRVVQRWTEAQLEAGGARLSHQQEQALIDAVLAELFELGRFQPYVDDPNVENVMALGCDRVRIEYADGRIETGAPVADSDEGLVDFLQNLARRGGQNERSLSTAKPVLHMRLPGGARLAAMYRLAQRPMVVIRRHRTRDVDLDTLVTMGMIDPALAGFLRAAMRARLNIMIAGLPGAGKTTLLRALAAEIPSTEWWATMENELELHLHELTDRHPWVVAIEAREGHGDRGVDGRPGGEIAIGDLLPDTLRFSMTRVIVGEVRSSEVLPMLEAMQVSRGSLCTLHARTPHVVFDRIVELALRYGPSAASDRLAYASAANALDLIVYVEMVDETAVGGRRLRFVSHVLEVQGLGEFGKPAVTEVFGPGPDGRGVPQHLPERTLLQLRRAGFEPQQHRPGAGQWREPLHSVVAQP